MRRRSRGVLGAITADAAGTRERGPLRLLLSYGTPCRMNLPRCQSPIPFTAPPPQHIHTLPPHTQRPHGTGGGGGRGGWEQQQQQEEEEEEEEEEEQQQQQQEEEEEEEEEQQALR